MGWKKLLVIVGLLLVLLIVPVFSILGVVDVSKFSLISAPASFVEPASSSSTPMVFMDPAQNITDYEDPVHNVTIGSSVTFHMNISDVTDLFAWQLNVTWDTAILNVSRIIPSEFLARSVNLTSSEILGFVINSTGSVLAAEAIMADTTGINGSGRLVTIEFEIVGYGYTDLSITVSGTFPTTLLNSTDSSMTFTTADGYFRNVISGDITDDSPGIPPDTPDGDVDGFDLGEFADAFGSSVGSPNYNLLADLTDDSPGVPPDNPDGDVDGFDLGVFADNFGRSTSLP